jgi:hypothetical protein
LQKEIFQLRDNAYGKIDLILMKFVLDHVQSSVEIKLFQSFHHNSYSLIVDFEIINAYFAALRTNEITTISPRNTILDHVIQVTDSKERYHSSSVFGVCTSWSECNAAKIEANVT